jgi:hypothetical protein
LNETLQLLTYAVAVSLLEDNMYTIRKIVESLIESLKKVDLEVNSEVIKLIN